jgi:hypothetical protein
MKFRSATAGAAMVIGAMTIALGTAHADPAPAPAKDDIVDYSVKLVDKAVVATLRGGTFQVVDQPGATPRDKPRQVVDVKDHAGNIAMEMPLDYRISGVPIPVRPVVKQDGKVLELTPQKPQGVDITQQTVVAQVVASPGQKTGVDQADTQQPGKRKIIAQPIASPQENSAAMSDFATQFSLAIGVGSFVGLAIGAVVGCIFGLPLFGVGCLAGIPIGATLGGIVGTIVAGGPTLVAAGVDLMNTIKAKPGTTKWEQSVTQQPGSQQPARPQASPQH